MTNSLTTDAATGTIANVARRDPHRDGGFDPQPGVARPSHAEMVRTLIDEQGRAVLSTIGREPAGFPFGSLVTYFADSAGDPWLLISAMAEHTANATADDRASVLVSAVAPAGSDPLASARTTLVGKLREAKPPDSVRTEFLTRHPGAKFYVDFPDFSWWKLEVQSVRYVGGFGRMSWVGLDEFRAATPDPIAPFRDAICAHMNADHAESHPVLLHHALNRDDIVSAVMTSVDRLGCDLDAVTTAGNYPLRLPFPAPVSSAEEVRSALVTMLAEARLAAS